MQLQGLDLGPIYTVLQWLVKKLIESRDERNIKSKVTANFYYENILGNLVKREKENNNQYNKNIFNPIIQNKNKVEKFKENVLNKNEKEIQEEENENKNLSDFLKKQEKAIDAKYNLVNKGRLYKPNHNYDFESNDPLRIYFNLIEYGMHNDITFQKNLIDLLKKKGLVDETALEKDNSK